VETKHTHGQGNDIVPTTDGKDEGQLVRRGRANTGKHIGRGKKEGKKRKRKEKKNQIKSTYS
jgi:hypothetical protein